MRILSRSDRIVLTSDLREQRVRLWKNGRRVEISRKLKESS